MFSDTHLSGNPLSMQPLKLKKNIKICAKQKDAHAPGCGRLPALSPGWRWPIQSARPPARWPLRNFVY